MTSTPPASGTGARIPTPPLYKVAVTQLGVLLPTTLVVSAGDPGLAVSVLLGGLAAVLPQAWYAWYAFREGGAQAGDRVVQRLLRGEATKLGLVALACAAGFRYVTGLQPAGFFISLALMMVLGWYVAARVLTAKVQAG